jgi:hypothetical protein
MVAVVTPDILKVTASAQGGGYTSVHQLEAMLRGMFRVSARLSTGDGIEAFIDHAHSTIDAFNQEIQNEKDLNEKKRKEINYKELIEDKFCNPKSEHFDKEGWKILTEMEYRGIYYNAEVCRDRLVKKYVGALATVRTLPPEQASLVLKAFEQAQKIYILDADSSGKASEALVNCFKESVKMEASDLYSVLGANKPKEGNRVNIYPGYKLVTLWKGLLNRFVVFVDSTLEGWFGYGPLRKFRQLVNFFKVMTPGTPTNKAHQYGLEAFNAHEKTKPEMQRLMADLNENIFMKMTPQARQAFTSCIKYSGLSVFSPQNLNPFMVTDTEITFPANWNKVREHTVRYETNQVLNEADSREASFYNNLYQVADGRGTYPTYSMLGDFYDQTVKAKVEEIEKFIACLWGDEPQAAEYIKNTLHLITLRKKALGTINNNVEFYTLLSKLLYTIVAPKINPCPAESTDNTLNRVNAILRGGDIRTQYLAFPLAALLTSMEARESPMRNDKNNVFMDRGVRESLDAFNTIVPFAKTGKELAAGRTTEVTTLTTLFSDLIEFNQRHKAALSRSNNSEALVEEVFNLASNIYGQITGMGRSGFLNTPNLPLLNTVIKRYNKEFTGLKLPDPCKPSQFVNFIAENLFQGVREVFRVHMNEFNEQALKFTDTNPITDVNYKPSVNARIPSEKEGIINGKPTYSCFSANDFKSGPKECFVLEVDWPGLLKLAHLCEQNPSLKITEPDPQKALKQLQNLMLGMPKEYDSTKPEEAQLNLFQDEGYNKIKDNCAYVLEDEEDIQERNPAFYGTIGRIPTRQDSLCPSFRNISYPMIRDIQTQLRKIYPSLKDTDRLPMFDPNNNPDQKITKNMPGTSKAFGRFHNDGVAELPLELEQYVGCMRFQGPAEGVTSDSTPQAIYWQKDPRTGQYGVAYVSGQYYKKAVEKYKQLKADLIKEYDLQNPCGSDPEKWTSTLKESFVAQWGVAPTIRPEDWAFQSLWTGHHAVATSDGVSSSFRALRQFSDTLKHRGRDSAISGVKGKFSRIQEQLYPFALDVATALQKNEAWVGHSKPNEQSRYKPADTMTFANSWGQMWGVFGWIGGFLGTITDTICAAFKIPSVYMRLRRGTTNVLPSQNYYHGKDGRTVSVTTKHLNYLAPVLSCGDLTNEKIEARLAEGEKKWKSVYSKDPLHGKTTMDFYNIKYPHSNPLYLGIDATAKETGAISDYRVSLLTNKAMEAMEKPTAANNIIHFLRTQLLAQNNKN